MLEIIITAGLLIFILWILFSHHKTTERNAKAINMSVFSIKSIEIFTDELDLLDVFRNMHLKGWNRFLYGDPYIGIEKVIKNGAAKYYLAIPKKYEGILEQNPHVSKTEEKIFPEEKNYIAVYLDKNRPSVKFGELKLHEEEGMVLQILARHLHHGSDHFESNVRVMAWADSRDRAAKILGLKKIKNRENRKNVFDFFYRIFQDGKRVKLSFTQLKEFLIDKFAY